MSEQPLLQVHNLKTYFYTEDTFIPISLTCTLIKRKHMLSL